MMTILYPIENINEEIETIRKPKQNSGVEQHKKLEELNSKFEVHDIRKNST